MFLLLRMSRVWITTEPNVTMNSHQKDERVENIKAVLLNWTWDTYSADVYIAAPTFLIRYFLLLFPFAGVTFAAFTQRRWCSTTGRLVIHISLVFRIGFQLMGCAIRKQSSIRRPAPYKRKSPADKSTRRVSFWPHFIQHHAAFFQVHIMRFLANCTALRCVYINYSSFFKIETSLKIVYLGLLANCAVLLLLACCVIALRIGIGYINIDFFNTYM